MSALDKILGVKSLPPMVKINMNNYGDFQNIKELREMAKSYLNSLRGVDFSLEESNPKIKFTLSKESVWHLTSKSGKLKLIATKQLPQIFQQGIIMGVENEQKGDKNVDHVLKCGTYIMIESDVFIFYFVLKMKKGDKNYIYDGNIDISKPE